MKGLSIPYTKHIGFNNNNNFHKLNSDGLNKAYNNNNKIHVDNDTLYIAGTSNLKDVYDDITTIPVWGNIKDSTRYNQAKTALDFNPSITKIIGHSLGGSVALEFQKIMQNIILLRMVHPFYNLIHKKVKDIVFPLTPLVTWIGVQ